MLHNKKITANTSLCFFEKLYFQIHLQHVGAGLGVWGQLILPVTRLCGLSGYVTCLVRVHDGGEIDPGSGPGHSSQ